MPRLRLRILNSCIISVITLSPVEASDLSSYYSNDIAMGTAAYSKRDFAEARRIFTKATAEYPRDAYRAYWLAICDLKLGMYDEAYSNFINAKRFDADGSVAKLADNGIAQTERALRLSRIDEERYALQAVAPPLVPFPITGTDPWTSDKFAALRGYGTSRAKPPHMSVIDVRNPLERLKEQTDFERSLRVTQAEQLATASQRTSARSLDALQRRDNRELSDMRNASISDNNGNSYPLYSQSDINRVSEIYKQREQNLARAQAASINDQRLLGLQKSAEVFNSSYALMEQMQGRNEPDGLKLNPVGSNLFVRNFGVSTGSSSQPKTRQIEELVADQERLILSPINKVRKSAHDPLNPASHASALKVHGQVLPADVRSGENK